MGLKKSIMARMTRKHDLLRGSLVGGAIGDAMGYPVEFMKYREIIAKYGQPGITSYELRNGVAEISDDTQMTLFTANGMLMGMTRFYMRGIGSSPHNYVEYAYRDWYYTQTKSFQEMMNATEPYIPYRHTWLSALPEFYSRRAPGITCMQSIRDIIDGKIPENDSKGCGGVMRVAPWPLFCACHKNRFSINEIDLAGGEIARLTHKHPLGWLPAIVLTHILYKLMKGRSFSNYSVVEKRKKFAEIVIEALRLLPKLKEEEFIASHEPTWDMNKILGEVFEKQILLLDRLVRQALLLAEGDDKDIKNIKLLGEGWVGEEALAIAIYVVARHIDDFSSVIIAAVNHDGDSDSTGSIAGNIMGAIVGYKAIPDKFKKNLELVNIILAIADDLHQGCIISEYDTNITPAKMQWHSRYCDMLPLGIKDYL